MNKRVHIFISGDVTGVGFRYWTSQNAKKLGLTGWVRNAERDLVEAVFEGEKMMVEELVKKCHQGPMLASVKNVDIEWQDAEDEFISFEVRY